MATPNGLLCRIRKEVFDGKTTIELTMNTKSSLKFLIKNGLITSRPTMGATYVGLTDKGKIIADYLISVGKLQ